MIGIIDVMRPKINNLRVKNRITRLCYALLTGHHTPSKNK